MVCKEFFSIKRCYSLEYAVYCFLWWIGFYFRWNKLNILYTQKKQVWLDKYIECYYADIVDKYINLEESKTPTCLFKIWVFWAQGEAKMPPLVRVCYRQIVLNNIPGSVVLLDLDNVKQYVELPDVVYEKLKQGKLLHAHFSDILRNALLAKYGGMWLDATCWVAHSLPQMAYENVFFSPHNAKDGTYWCTYAMGSNRIGSVTFSFVRDILIAVCQREEIWPDYLFQDRVLSFAHRKLYASKKAIDSTPENSTKRFLLYPMMNKELNKKEYEKLLSTDWLFKLSYKSFYIMECNGKPTLWASMLDGSINQ